MNKTIILFSSMLGEYKNCSFLFLQICALWLMAYLCTFLICISNKILYYVLIFFNATATTEYDWCLFPLPSARHFNILLNFRKLFMKFSIIVGYITYHSASGVAGNRFKLLNLKTSPIFKYTKGVMRKIIIIYRVAFGNE